jgi:hypothetical protein
MYLYDSKHGDAMQGDGLTQPRFDNLSILKADRLDIWASSFDDEGPDHTDFRLMKGDEFITSSKMMGY